jgi:hypothetical protein
MLTTPGVAPRHNRLERGHDGGEGDNRVARFVRTSRVRSDADELDLEGIRGCGERPFVGHHLPDIESSVHVAAENRRDTVEGAALENGERALPHFLGRLEDNEHVAFGRLLHQQRRRADRPRRMNVVTARMHHVRDDRRVRKARRLLNRQRVDVAAHRHDGRRRVTTADASNHPRLANATHVVDSQLAKRGFERTRRANLVERELRLAMQLSAERH